MCKILSAIFFTLILSLNLQANDDEKVPSHWLEEENSASIENPKKTFLDETRLKCVSVGYKEATGETPSHIFLAALAMRARVDGKKDNRSIRLTKTDEITYKGLDDLRKDYLSNVAQQVAMSGACVNDDISDELDNLDYTNLIKVIDLPDSLIPKGNTEGAYSIDKLDKLARTTTDWDYSDLRKLFPLRPGGTPFTDLSYKDKKELLKKSYADHFKRNMGLLDAFKKTPTTGKFVNCYDRIEKNRNKDTIQTVNGEIAPGEICRSIRTACGYSSDASFCGGFPEPVQRRTGCPKPSNPCATKGSSGTGGGAGTK